MPGMYDYMGFGNAMMGAMPPQLQGRLPGGMGGSARDSAPQMPGINPNLGAPANYWQGNQFQIPGLAQYLAQAQGQRPQGMASMMGEEPMGKPKTGVERGKPNLLDMLIGGPFWNALGVDFGKILGID